MDTYVHANERLGSTKCGRFLD